MITPSMKFVKYQRIEYNEVYIGRTLNEKQTAEFISKKFYWSSGQYTAKNGRDFDAAVPPMKMWNLMNCQGNLTCPRMGWMILPEAKQEKRPSGCLKD